jgi:exodeoxyribonuclease VII large subunit
MQTIGLPSGIKVLTVGELTRQVKGVMEEAFPPVWVSGEVTNLSRPSSGHIYLTLKDPESRVRAVIWRSAVQRLRVALRDGLEVVARGRLSVYVPHGEYKLEIDTLMPKGMGALELALRQLKEKLARLGYFAPERKKKLPLFPRRAAVITSPTGAAVRDILEVLARRWPALEVWICPVRVQGDGAAQEIAAAITTLNRFAAIDVMIVGRGGGSSEDLWAFNCDCVAQAIFTSRIPVVSAVGHEIDLTIADLVADCRALTPSEAAERIVPDQLEIKQALNKSEARLRTLLLQRLESACRRLDGLAERRCFRQPLEKLRDHERKLDEIGERLQRSLRQRLVGLQQHLKAQAGRLESLSPLNVLARGYSLTRKEADRTVVHQAAQVLPGDYIVTTLQQGRIRSRVESTQENGAETPS